jgi:hypothetical protein
MILGLARMPDPNSARVHEQVEFSACESGHPEDPIG